METGLNTLTLIYSNLINHMVVKMNLEVVHSKALKQTEEILIYTSNYTTTTKSIHLRLTIQQVKVSYIMNGLINQHLLSLFTTTLPL